MATGKKNVKFYVIGVIAIVAIIAVIVGAQIGKTKIGSPSEIEAAANKENTVQQSTAKPAEGTAAAATEAVSTAAAPASTVAAAGTIADEDLIPIRTATRKTCTLAPLLVADKQGFFKEEGLKLVFTGELGANQLLPTILAGQNDLGDAHPNYLAVAVAGGAQVKGVARSIIEPGPNEDPALRHMRWYVNPDSTVKKWSDLKDYNVGKTIKISGTKNSCSEFLPNKISDANGIERSRFEFVTFDKDLQAIQAAKQGVLDIAGIHPTFYKSAEDAGLRQIADSSETGLGEAAGIYLYYFTNEFIAKNPDTVHRFVRAITKAQQWANANRVQTAKWTEEFIGVPVTGNHYYSDTAKINEDHIKPWVEDLENTGVIPKGKVKISDIITHEFEEQAAIGTEPQKG
jgi:ABC-type nitrate/sulfonate/bicarbonate transport system substrate-binding protein